MKAPVGFLSTVVLISLVHPLVARSGSQPTVCITVNWPALQQSDPAYRDAVDVARALTGHGFVVQCIAPSRMTGTFEG